MAVAEWLRRETVALVMCVQFAPATHFSMTYSPDTDYDWKDIITCGLFAADVLLAFWAVLG